jgi:hypothetical protein
MNSIDCVNIFRVDCQIGTLRFRLQSGHAPQGGSVAFPSGGRPTHHGSGISAVSVYSPSVPSANIIISNNFLKSAE